MGTPGGCTAYYHSVSKVWAADFAHAEVKALHKKSNKEGKKMSDKRARRRSEKIKRLYERHRRIHKLLRKYGNDIIHSDNFRKTKRHIQHGNMTVNDHCLSVARHSLILDKKLGLHCNRRDLTTQVGENAAKIGTQNEYVANVIQCMKDMKELLNISANAIQTMGDAHSNQAEVIKKTVTINEDIAESIRNENEQFNSINAMAESNANDTTNVAAQANAINYMVEKMTQLLTQNN